MINEATLKWLNDPEVFRVNKNHPSILIWSCGNESYAGENILNRIYSQYFFIIFFVFIIKSTFIS